MSETIEPQTPGLPATTSNPWVMECPPSGMDGLIQCYDDVNQATAFLTAIFIDQLNNNPAVAEAIVQAITKTGYALPLLGTTNGTPAVPPQVGQYVQFSATLPYTATPASALLSLGVLPPGDWDCWLWATFTSVTSGAQWTLNPLPAGFAANPAASTYSATLPPIAPLASMTVEALTAVDSLIVADTQVVASSGQSGVMTVNFAARRRR